VTRGNLGCSELEPSRFYRQHVALDAPEIDTRSFRPYWRVRTRLDQLLIDRAISHLDWLAGVMFRIWAERALGAAYGGQSLSRADRSPIDFSLSAVRQIDARGRLHKIRADLGPIIFGLLELHVVEDRNWQDIARTLRCHPTTARKWTIDALRALAAAIWT
jgi:hypothetical protein